MTALTLTAALVFIAGFVPTLQSFRIFYGDLPLFVKFICPATIAFTLGIFATKTSVDHNADMFFLYYALGVLFGVIYCSIVSIWIRR